MVASAMAQTRAATAAAWVDSGPQVAHPQTRTILPLLAASYTTIFNANGIQCRLRNGYFN
jgi:hypothetical protein